jgi:hypothetical protein
MRERKKEKKVALQVDVVTTNVWSKFTEIVRNRMKINKKKKNKYPSIRRELFHCHRLHSQGPPVRLGKRQNRSGRLRPCAVARVLFFLSPGLVCSAVAYAISFQVDVLFLTSSQLPNPQKELTKQLAHEPSIAS